MILLNRIKKTLELMFADEKIREEIEEQIVLGEQLARQQSSIRHEEEDEEAQLAKIRRGMTSMTKRESESF